ncbi:hypothetical protein PITCH_A930013 [uncultured Desulfobacterium sp.]|uniref:Uncharacterized protein n=1 Tax=uncultured Desulfobacterium sp. TaxID=201089 RepID=A0A445N401_9BACT|nr:hypothetical protein PITCH_A930013 [uncultured Desulfobacterium sp.]
MHHSPLFFCKRSRVEFIPLRQYVKVFSNNEEDLGTSIVSAGASWLASRHRHLIKEEAVVSYYRNRSFYFARDFEEI